MIAAFTKKRYKLGVVKAKTLFLTLIFQKCEIHHDLSQ